MYCIRFNCSHCSYFAGLLLLLVTAAPIFASPLVISTQKEFTSNLKNDLEIGPVTESYKILFEQIGIPENLQYIPTARVQSIIETEKSVCTLFNRKTPARQKKYLFSLPISFGIGHHLFQQKTLRPIEKRFLNAAGELVAVDLLLSERPSETIIVYPNSSYGQILDEQIKRIEDRQKVYRWAGDEHNSQALMFAHERADYALLMEGELQSLPIAYDNLAYRRYSIENVSKPIGLYAMCTKDEDSEIWLDRLNKAMLAIYQTPRYQEAHRQTYSEADWQLILKEINKFSQDK